MIKQLNDTAARAGRGPMEVVLRAFTAVLDQANSKGRAPMVGSISEIREDIGRLREIGVTHLIHSPSEIGFTSSADIAPGIRLMETLIEL